VMSAVGCGQILGAPAWFAYAMEGRSYPVARLLAVRDRALTWLSTTRRRLNRKS
jgi:hypothetical protein